MKKSRIASFSIVALFVLASLACSGGQVETAQPTKASPPKVETGPATSPKPASSTLTPESVAVSKLNTEFTAKPECDGGECVDVNFSAGFKFPGDEKIHSKVFRFGSFSYDVGKAKLEPAIVEGKRLYESLSKLEPKKLTVTVVDGEITKIVSIAEINGRVLTPEVVLYEAK